MKRYQPLLTENVDEIYDSFKKHNAPFINVLDRNGNEKTIPSDEAYSSEYMTKSDVTGMNLRWVAIKDGKAMSLFSAYGVKPVYGKAPQLQVKSLQKVLLKMPKEDLEKLFRTIDFSVFSDWKDYNKRAGNVPVKVGKDSELIQAAYYLNGKGSHNWNSPAVVLSTIAMAHFK